MCCSKTKFRASSWNGVTGACVGIACLLAAGANAIGSPDSSGLFVGKDGDGQLEVFRVDDAGKLCHRWRKAANGAWSAWVSLGGSLLPGVGMVNDTNGEMQIFGVDRISRSLEGIRQLTTNSLSWSAWTNFGGRFESPPVAERNADGRIEVFAVDADTHEVKHLWQTDAPGGWSAWTSLGGSLEPGLVAARNQDGRLGFVLERGTYRTVENGTILSEYDCADGRKTAVLVRVNIPASSLVTVSIPTGGHLEASSGKPSGLRAG